MKILIISLLLLYSVNTMAQKAPYTQTKKLSTEQIKGICKTARAGGADVTKYCSGLVIKNKYINNRTEFTFVLQNLGFISFSGTQSNEEPSQRNYYLLVDTMYSELSMAGRSTENIKGSCEINTQNGSITLNCKTEDHTGFFEFSITGNESYKP